MLELMLEDVELVIAAGLVEKLADLELSSLRVGTDSTEALLVGY